ncbi:hypothetical protein [Paeniglutamicibacter gangotriensis]|uniref:hypothetical protein n=1 Tax=Paeniglutamicibacter gangotriensis TaxID=254787 RepID=UPI001F4366A2|nr:hypothetical protein [Paeniglutamicibacter gangotriensis]
MAQQGADGEFGGEPAGELCKKCHCIIKGRGRALCDCFDSDGRGYRPDQPAAESFVFARRADRAGQGGIVPRQVAEQGVAQQIGTLAQTQCFDHGRGKVQRGQARVRDHGDQGPYEV